jgi:hypothetical protein
MSLCVSGCYDRTFVDTINLLLLHRNEVIYHICTCVDMIAESVCCIQSN